MAEILRGVVALEVDPDSFPPFVFRLTCGHTVAVSREHIPPDAAAPPTEVRCLKCERGDYNVCDYGVISDDPVH